MKEIEQTPELLTVNEASGFLRLKPSTIRSWLLKRKVPFVKLGSRVFLRTDDCLALIQSGIRPARQQGGAA